MKMRTGSKAAIMALAGLMCHSIVAKGESDMDVFVGGWAGVNKHGTRFEVRVDSISDDGKVRGARCGMRKSWIDTIFSLEATNAVARDVNGKKAIVMQLTDAHVKLRVVGNAAQITLEMVDERNLTYTVIPSRKAQKKGTRTTTARMKRASRLPCLDRYSAEPIPRPAPSGGDALPIIGHWSDPSRKGKVLETAIERISPAGIVEGWFCIKMRETGDIQIVDLEPTAKPRYRARYDAASQSITFERNRIEKGGKRRRDRWVMTLTDDGKLNWAITNRYKSRKAKTTKGTFERGADPEGCLVHTMLRGTGFPKDSGIGQNSGFGGYSDEKSQKSSEAAGK